MIGDNVLRGEPFEGIDIFDIHAHIGRTADFMQLDTCAGDVVRTLDRLGAACACVSSILSIHCDTPRGNREVLDAVKRYPGRLYGYLTVSPHDNAADPSPYFAETGMLGMKVHAAFHRTRIEDERYAPFYEYADRHSLPVLFHAWEARDSAAIAALAKRYHNARFIIGHGAMREWNVKKEAIEAVRRYENVFADTTVSTAYDGAIEFAVKRIGAQRLCYGSDLPFYDCRHVLGKVATSLLSDGDKEKILGGNARRILFAAGQNS